MCMYGRGGREGGGEDGSRRGALLCHNKQRMEVSRHSYPFSRLSIGLSTHFSHQFLTARAAELP